MNIMREWQKRFEDGTYIHKWNGYSPFYIGIFYGYRVVLGDEQEFTDCAGFFSGIGDVEWWDKSKLDVLSDNQKEKLNRILKRNFLLDEFVQSNFYVLEDIFGKDKAVNLRRFKNIDILRLFYMMDRMNNTSNLVDYCISNSIKELEILDFLTEDLRNKIQRMINQINAEEWEKCHSNIIEDNDEQFINNIIIELTSGTEKVL